MREQRRAFDIAADRAWQWHEEMKICLAQGNILADLGAAICYGRMKHWMRRMIAIDRQRYQYEAQLTTERLSQIEWWLHH